VRSGCFPVVNTVCADIPGPRPSFIFILLLVPHAVLPRVFDISRRGSMNDLHRCSLRGFPALQISMILSTWVLPRWCNWFHGLTDALATERPVGRRAKAETRPSILADDLSVITVNWNSLNALV
jgi:hypothetical protein